MRDAPFIAYEMKDLHADEDWDAVRERYKLRQYYTAQNGVRMTNYVAYDGSNIATVSLLYYFLLYSPILESY